METFYVLRQPGTSGEPDDRTTTMTTALQPSYQLWELTVSEPTGQVGSQTITVTGKKYEGELELPSGVQVGDIYQQGKVPGPKGCCGRTTQVDGLVGDTDIETSIQQALNGFNIASNAEQSFKYEPTTPLAFANV